MAELVDGAAIQLFRRHEFGAGFHQRVEDEELRRMARRRRQRRGAAFERRDAFLEHGVGRVGEARVDVAEDLKLNSEAAWSALSNT